MDKSSETIQYRGFDWVREKEGKIEKEIKRSSAYEVIRSEMDRQQERETDRERVRDKQTDRLTGRQIDRGGEGEREGKKIEQRMEGKKII